MAISLENYNKLSKTGKIGISIPLPEVIKVKDTSDKYFIDELPKKLTKANSFIILDEVFIIRKKDYLGKASKTYHIFRHSDGRLICNVPIKDKDKAIELVTGKYFEYN